MDGDDGVDGFPIVGPQGPQGPAGGGGGSATTVEKNLGSTPVFEGRFTITDATITGTSKVHVWQAPGPYTGKGARADEAAMDFITCIATPAAGSAEVYWRVDSGYAPQVNEPRGSDTMAAQGASVYRAPFVMRRVGRVKGNVKFTYTVA